MKIYHSRHFLMFLIKSFLLQYQPHRLKRNDIYISNRRVNGTLFHTYLQQVHL